MRKCSRLKGISPLVAVIMLIAFTMVVAGILASWASQFAITQRQQIQTCSQAAIRLQSGVYNSTGTGALDLVVWNTGDVPLTAFTVLVTYTNDSISRYPQNLNISAGDIETISIPKMTSNIKEVVVSSNECRGAQDMLLKYNIKGLS